MGGVKPVPQEEESHHKSRHYGHFIRIRTAALAHLFAHSPLPIRHGPGTGPQLRRELADGQSAGRIRWTRTCSRKEQPPSAAGFVEALATL